MDSGSALDALDLENLQGVVVATKPSPAGPDVILWQRPKPGKTVREGAVVRLVVAKAPPRVPDVTDMSLVRAKQTLHAQGYRVHIRRRVSPLPTGELVSQRPTGRLMPGRVVTLVVDREPPPPPTNDYLPPLPPAYDYDCAGGTGDGPAYTGTVQVVGDDIYGLDANSDGWGCE
jgi:beta-lactam-binding protein with PASTA domain